MTVEPRLGTLRRPPEERFWEKVDKTETCWLWTGAREERGYGHFTPARGGHVMAHRFAYEALVGPIPEGLQIDHLCEVKACVNPAHLEPVTASVNLRRRYERHPERYQETCHLGHPLDAWRRDGKKVYRYCRKCNKDSKGRMRQRRLVTQMSDKIDRLLETLDEGDLLHHESVLYVRYEAIRRVLLEDILTEATGAPE